MIKSSARFFDYAEINGENVGKLMKYKTVNIDWEVGNILDGVTMTICFE